MKKLFFIFILSFLKVSLGNELKDVYHCGENVESKTRILFVSIHENYIFDRILRDYSGRQIPEKTADGRLFKRSSHLLITTGNVNGGSKCLTVIETPQIFTQYDVMDVSEEISQTCFQKMMIAIEIKDKEITHTENQIDVLVSLLVLIRSLYEEELFSKIEFLFILENESDLPTQDNIVNFQNKILSRIFDEPPAIDGSQTIILTPSTSIEQGLLSTQVACDCWEPSSEATFFSKLGVSWMGHPTNLEVEDHVSKVDMTCYFLTESYDETLVQIVNEERNPYPKSAVTWTMKKERNDLRAIQITAESPENESVYQCIFDNGTSINSVKVKKSSSYLAWSEWTSWQKCDKINSTTIRVRRQRSEARQMLIQNSLTPSDNIETQTRACYCSDLNSLPNPRFLLLGPTGVGKSTLGNLLLGGYKAFASGHSMDSKTDYISVASANFLGTRGCITMIDTPGAKDTKGRDYQHTLEMQKLLKSEIKSFDVILLLVHGGQTRFDASTVELIKWYEAVFGSEMWKHVIIEITFWQHSKNAERNRKRTRRVDEQSMSKELRQKLHQELQVSPKINVPIVFIDPTLQLFADPCVPGYQKPEPNEIIKFDKYLTSLMQAASKIPPFDCKSRCQAPDEFYSGTPWVYNLPDNKLYLQPGKEAIIEWQIWEGVSGNASSAFTIMFDTEMIVKKTNGTLINFIDEPSQKRSEYKLRIEETKILQKIAAIRLHLSLDPHIVITILSRIVSLSNGPNSIGTVEILVSKDAEIGSWSAWSQCSITCLGTNLKHGTRNRVQICSPETNHGKSCSALLNDTSIPLGTEGQIVESGFCAGDSPTPTFCPEDLTWSIWSPWGSCSADCGPGIKRRSRFCSDGKFGGKKCTAHYEDETEPCILEPVCPQDCALSEWGPWSSCSSTCLGQNQDGSLILSTKTRTKEILDEGNGLGRNCNLYTTEEFSQCIMPPCPVDGIWSEWSEYSSCSSECGPATKHRYRTCSGPLYNGRQCEGQNKEKVICDNQPCPVNCQWSYWDDWSYCSETCGSGQRFRQRSKNDEDLINAVAKPCHGNSNQTEGCFVARCPVDGVWSEWYANGLCSTRCGDGITMKHRFCIGPYHGGSGCFGRSQEESICNARPCPIDCQYTEWESWSRCTATCGGGSRNRKRMVEIEAEHGGKSCRGTTEEMEDCGRISCPVHGEWSSWMTDGICSRTCGSGFYTERRYCVGPFHGGRECSGFPSQQKPCNTNPCPVDCVWNDWGYWGSCDRNCGSGTKTRSRSIYIHPQHGGRSCPGSYTDYSGCYVQPCREWRCTKRVFGICFSKGWVNV